MRTGSPSLEHRTKNKTVDLFSIFFRTGHSFIHSIDRSIALLQRTHRHHTRVCMCVAVLVASVLMKLLILPFTMRSLSYLRSYVPTYYKQFFQKSIIACRVVISILKFIADLRFHSLKATWSMKRHCTGHWLGNNPPKY